LKIAILLIAGLGSVAVGLGYSASLHRAADGGYLTAPTEIGNVVTTVSATGRVDAVVTVDVSSQLSGLVEEVFVDFNDEVTKGQPLAKLDQQGFQATVREAEANLAVAEVDVQAKRVAVDRAVNSYQRSKAEAKVYTAQTARARADYGNAKRELERKEALTSKGHISESDVDGARAEYEGALAGLQAAKAEQVVHEEKIKEGESELQQATAEVRSALAAVPQKEAVLSQAKVELERSIIRSPIDGIVIKREVEPGQTVAASLEAPILFTIAQDLRQMEVHAKVDEADIGEIQVRQRVTFTVDAFPRQSFSGVVAQVRKAPEVVQNVVIYTVVIATENPDLLLLPGMTVLAEIVVRESGETLTVPNAALRFNPPEDVVREAEDQASSSIAISARGQKATVWVLDESGTPAPVSVMTDMTNGIVTEVTSGALTVGQQLIVGEAPTEDGRSFLGLKFGF
jgi:HlyD family secretion protein